jgi:hypothetical protein
VISSQFGCRVHHRAAFLLSACAELQSGLWCGCLKSGFAFAFHDLLQEPPLPRIAPWATPFPSIDVRLGVHSPENIAASGSGGRVSHGRSRSVLVVLHHLDGFLRSGVAGLSHPAADPGVHCVSSRRRAAIAGRSSSRSPQCGSHPSEESPRSQPSRVTALVAPSPLLHRKLRFRSASRLCSVRESVTSVRHC